MPKSISILSAVENDDTLVVIGGSHLGTINQQPGLVQLLSDKFKNSNKKLLFGTTIELSESESFKQEWLRDLAPFKIYELVSNNKRCITSLEDRKLSGIPSAHHGHGI